MSAFVVCYSDVEGGGDLDALLGVLVVAGTILVFDRLLDRHMDL